MNTNTFTKMKKFIIMAALLPMSLFAQQGNVGINTLTPGARLDVDGTGVPEVLRLQNLPKTLGLISDKMLVIDTVSGSYFVRFADMPISSVCSTFPIQGNGTTGSCLTFVPGVNQNDAFLWNATTNTWEIKPIEKWDLLGNAGTNPNVNFLGTTDAQDLVFRTNNIEQIRTLASNGFVGIGTSTPIAKLHVNEGAIYATNATPIVYPGSGTLPNVPSGPGTRFMWIPEKSAMRFGTVNVEGTNVGDDWDPAKIGDFSSANGYNAEASGIFSFAVGNNVKATGEGSTALGKFINTTHNGSYQIGDSPNNGSVPASILNSSAANQFSARFNSGYRFFTDFLQNPDGGVYIQGGASSNPNIGSLGIGIASPTQKLHVKGNALFTALAGTGTRFVTADASGVLGTAVLEDYVAGTGVVFTTAGNTTTVTTAAHTGDAIGTVNLRVVRLQNVPVSGALPTAGQVLTYNGAQWVPTTPTGVTKTITINVPSGTCTLTYVNGVLTATTCP